MNEFEKFKELLNIKGLDFKVNYLIGSNQIEIHDPVSSNSYKIRFKVTNGRYINHLYQADTGSRTHLITTVDFSRIFHMFYKACNQHPDLKMKHYL